MSDGLICEKSLVRAEYPTWCSSWVDVGDVSDPVSTGVSWKRRSPDHTHPLCVWSTLRPGLGDAVLSGGAERHLVAEKGK